MIEQSLVLQKTANEFLTYIGIDSPEHAISKDHFVRYPKLVVYQFNNFGYRDLEWPADINNLIWCIGDSFTVGLGQPFEETWPQLVQQELTTRVINISMNGASNDWISRRAKFILNSYNPTALFIQWSYLHRREHPDNNLVDEDRALNYNLNDTLDVENLINNIQKIELVKNNSKIIHSFIPKFSESDADSNKIYKILKEKNINYFLPPPQVDFSRDGYHYDVETSKSYANLYIKEFNK